MASLLPGYEYDIFISYRHNDNRSGWVTEFVNDLREELAATIKHPVTIYFDSNVRDGLMENHLVDESLREKLKCLIFIPVISQTYCDAKSFAWEHEFKPFIQFAKADGLGRDIRLLTGNTASRLLPVRIHDIDEEDKNSIESAIGAPMRPIDFVFRSAGVNRPMRAKDDALGNHDRQVLYRNQINKVANSIKEVLTAIEKGTQRDPGVDEPRRRSATSSMITVKPKTQRRLWAVSAAALAVLILGYLLYYYIQQPGREPNLSDGKSIAVLPFVDMSPGHDQGYLGDGLAEAIINSLTEIKGLKVIGRTSSSQFKDEKIDLREIGERLKVSVVLEGSVQKVNDRIRITVQLINVSDNTHLWSERYDRDMDDIFQIQDDISTNILNNLKVTLLDAPVVRPITFNAQAYELYLRGLYEWRTYSPRGVDNSISLFKQAIDSDSSFAMAYAGLAWSYLGKASIFSAEMSGVDAANIGRPFIEKAIELDPDLGTAHSSLGFYKLYHDWDFEGARHHYEKALALSPNDPDVLSIYADYLNFVKDHERALSLSSEQTVVEPFYPNSRKPFALFFLNRPGEAMDFQLARLKVFNSYWNYDLHGFLNLNTGNYQGAILSFDKAIGMLGKRPPRMVGWLGAAHAKVGDRAAAEKLLAELNAMAATDNIGSPNFFMAVVHTALGEKQAALDALERAYEQHDWEMPWLITEPQLFPLHSEPRFKEIARKIGFKYPA